jgi:hypothetical protein
MLPSADGGILVCRAGGSVSELSRRTETFIVRIWAEYLEQTPAAWRGEIVHIGSGEVRRFGDLDEMDEYVQRCVRTQHQSSEQENER